MSTATASPHVFDTLDGHVNGLADQVSRLSHELDEMRRRDAVAAIALHRLDEEQRLAARLQRDFLPKKLPQSPGVRFHTIYRPAGYVSGDLYDVTRLDEHHVGLYVADAVGHGMPAALLTMFMKNALVTKQIDADRYRLLEPHETVARLNASLCAQNLSHATFATAIYGTIDLRTYELRFSTAGHPRPVLLRDGALSELPNDGALLGIFGDEVFKTSRATLRPGDRVFFYTDGVETAYADATPDDACWRAALMARSGLPTDELMRQLAERAEACDGAQQDDLTVIAMEIGEPAPSEKLVVRSLTLTPVTAQ